VEQERAQGHEDKPYGLVEDYLDEMAASGDAYRHPVIGYPPDIKAYTFEDAARFIDAHYFPQNATLVLVGDISARRVAPQLQRLFGDIARGEDRRLDRFENQILSHGDYSTTENRGKRPRLYMAFPLPPRTNRDSATILVLDHILVAGPHARFRQALLESDIAVAVNSDFEFRRDGGLYYLIVTLRSQRDAERARDAIEKVIKEIKSKGVVARELRRSRLSLRADQAIKAESSMYRATQIALGAAVFGDAHIFEHSLAQQDQVTSAEIAAAAVRYFDSSRRTTLVAQPVSR